MDVNGEIMAVPLSALSSFYTYFFILSGKGKNWNLNNLNKQYLMTDWMFPQ